MHGISWDSGDHEYKASGSLIRETLSEAVKVYVYRVYFYRVGVCMKLTKSMPMRVLAHSYTM